MSRNRGHDFRFSNWLAHLQHRRQQKLAPAGVGLNKLPFLLSFSPAAIWNTPSFLLYNCWDSQAALLSDRRLPTNHTNSTIRASLIFNSGTIQNVFGRELIKAVTERFHLLPVRPKLLKLYKSVNQREDCMVLPKPHILPWMKLEICSTFKITSLPVA